MSFNFYDYQDTEDIEQIHNAVLQILEKSGVSAISPTFLERAKKLGLPVDGHRILFPAAMVEKAIADAPSRFSLFGRDGGSEVVFGAKNAHSQMILGPPFINDLDTNQRREICLKDFEDFLRVADYLPAIDLVALLFPQGLPVESPVTKQVSLALKNSVKPIFIGVEFDWEIEYIIEVLAAVAGGLDAFRAKPNAYLQISPISPLDYAESPGNSLLKIVEAGIPLGIVNTMLMGATSPMTPIGTVAMGLAEMLSGITIAQLINPGHRCVMSIRTMTMNPRNGTGIYSPQNQGYIGAIMGQMSRHYDIPHTLGSFTTASKTTDEQASMEVMYQVLLSVVAGTDVNASCGTLDSGLCACFRKLIMDNEISNLMRRTLRGSDINTEVLAVDIIDEVVRGPRNFLCNKHTIKYLRSETWQPLLLDQNTYNSWLETKSTFGERATDLVKKILATHHCKPLSEEVQAKIDGVLARAAQKHYKL